MASSSMIAFVANTLNTLSTGRGELTMMFESTSHPERREIQTMNKGFRLLQNINMKEY